MYIWNWKDFCLETWNWNDSCLETFFWIVLFFKYVHNELPGIRLPKSDRGWWSQSEQSLCSRLLAVWFPVWIPAWYALPSNLSFMSCLSISSNGIAKNENGNLHDVDGGNVSGYPQSTYNELILIPSKSQLIPVKCLSMLSLKNEKSW